MSYKERKEYNKLEDELGQLEEQKSQIETEMNAESDYEKLQELSARYAELKSIIEEKEYRWLELAERA